MAKKVGILGPLLTYTHQAAIQYYGEAGVELVPCLTIDAVLEKVEAGEVTEGVVPEENVIEGTVRATIDGYYNRNVHLIGKTVLPINHYLGVLKGVLLDEVAEVLTKAEAFSQCSMWLGRNLPNAVLVPQNSTAYAAERISREGMRKAAAIAPELALKASGLEIIAAIGNLPYNRTMFAVVGKSLDWLCIGHGCDETTVIIHPNQDYEGQLVAYLGCFSRRGISLTRAESRPGIASRTPSDSRGDKMTYVFTLSFVGHYGDEGVKSALSDLQNICLYEGTAVKLVGSCQRVGLYGG